MTSDDLKRTAELGAELAVAMGALQEIRKLNATCKQASEIAEKALITIESDSLPDTWEREHAARFREPDREPDIPF